MRKSDKKVDNQLRSTLTEVCGIALEDFKGFQWLTHLVNYDNFPKSLKIVCIFDTNDNLLKFMGSSSNHELSKLIQIKLFDVGINLKNMNTHIAYDTEENCDENNNGKWSVRLAS